MDCTKINHTKRDKRRCRLFGVIAESGREAIRCEKSNQLRRLFSLGIARWFPKKMPSQEIKEYYDATECRDIRSDLIFAVNIVGDPKVAIDCGCGAGADIKYLLEQGFKVYGFDIEEESITRCKKRFKDSKDVILSQAGFSSYRYPRASLVVADASLFFCPMPEFDHVWRNIYECLYPKGIFCGSFLGPEDTMAEPEYHKRAFWPDVLVFDEEKVRGIFKGFEVCRFTEHKSSGKTALGIPHNWHIFSVVAKKI